MSAEIRGATMTVLKDNVWYETQYGTRYKVMRACKENSKWVWTTNGAWFERATGKYVFFSRKDGCHVLKTSNWRDIVRESEFQGENHELATGRLAPTPDLLLKGGTMSEITSGLKVIGRGTFSTVYQLDPDHVVIKTTDPAKECLCFFDLDSDRFPKLSLIEQSEDGTFYYRSKFYPKVRALKKNLKPREYRLYLALRDLVSSFTNPKRHDELYAKWYDIFGQLPIEFEEEIEELREALGQFANWGTDVCFEISPRNVAIEEGRLVYLDCFFFASKLIEAKQTKRFAF